MSNHSRLISFTYSHFDPNTDEMTLNGDKLIFVKYVLGWDERFCREPTGPMWSYCDTQFPMGPQNTCGKSERIGFEYRCSHVVYRMYNAEEGWGRYGMWKFVNCQNFLCTAPSKETIPVSGCVKPLGALLKISEHHCFICFDFLHYNEVPWFSGIQFSLS